MIALCKGSKIVKNNCEVGKCTDDRFCSFESTVTTLQKLDCFEELKQKSQDL